LYIEEIDSEKIRDFAHDAAAVSTSKIAYAEAAAAFAKKTKGRRVLSKGSAKNC